MCMLRWPDTASALLTSSPCPLYWVRLSLVLPGVLLKIVPDLWVGLIALKVRITPTSQPRSQPEQAQQTWELPARSWISRGPGPITCWTLQKRDKTPAASQPHPEH